MQKQSIHRIRNVFNITGCFRKLGCIRFRMILSDWVSFGYLTLLFLIIMYLFYRDRRLNQQREHMIVEFPVTTIFVSEDSDKAHEQIGPQIPNRPDTGFKRAC